MDRSECNKDDNSFSMDNDFDIVEHFSDDDDDSSKNDLPSPSYDPSGFPKAQHRSLLKFSLSKPQDYDESLLKPLEEMSLDEIKDAQNYLYQKLGKEMCDFIKERKLKRMEESKKMEKEKDKDKEIQQVEPKSASHLDGGNELIFKFDSKEFLKYQWMNPSETTKGDTTDKSLGQLSLHELRFDFEGRLLSYSETNDKSYDPSLYNHGLESDKPGYTFVELVHLLQSSFKPQVQISVRTLANVLFQSYLQYDSTDLTPEYHNQQHHYNSNSHDKCFFSYPQYRWKNYLNNDLDLLSKVGYSVCENQLSLSILVDSLRCLSLLLFGDSSTWNNFDTLDLNPNTVVQVQDVLFYYYQFSMGVDTYYWNPLFLDLTETNLFDGSDSIFENESFVDEENLSYDLNNNTNVNNNNNNNYNKNNGNRNTSSQVHLRLKRFYFRCLEGHYQSSSVGEIVKDLFGVVDERKFKGSRNSERETNKETDSNKEEMNSKLKMNSKLFLLSKSNILYKLLLIMQRYKDNVKVQLYCTTSICGFLRYFGTPLANALVEFSLFKSHFEWLAEFLLRQNSQEKGSVHLEGVFLYLVKYLSVYLDDLAGFFDTSSSVSIIKHALTNAFKKELKSLNMISDYDDDNNNNNTNSNVGNNMAYNRFAVTALNCMNVWSLREYLFDALDEFVPVVNLMMFQVKDLVKDRQKLNLFFKENSEKLAAFNLHFSSCVRMNEMYSHFEFNGVMRNVNDLVNLFATENLWNEYSGYYLYSLLQLQYDYVNTLNNNEFVESSEDEINEEDRLRYNREMKEMGDMKKLNEMRKIREMREKLKELEFSENSLVMILEMISGLVDNKGLEFPEELSLLTWFDEGVFGGSEGCIYNESMVKSHFSKSILPFNCLNLALNTLLKLNLDLDSKIELDLNLKSESELKPESRSESKLESRSVDNTYLDVGYTDKSYKLNKLDSLSCKLKERLFKLGEEIIKILKKVYFELHNTKRYYLNSSVYMVKSVPVYESWLVYLRSLVDLGFEEFDAVFAILALSVDYGLIENTLELLSSRFELKQVENVYNNFKKFNRYLSGYSLGSDKMPLVSFLSYLSYLPLLTNLGSKLESDSEMYSSKQERETNKETDSNKEEREEKMSSKLKMNSKLFLLKRLFSGTMSDKFMEWTFPRYLFSQLIYTLGTTELDNLFSEFESLNYYVFQKLLFNRLSASCELRVMDSEELLDRWVDALDKFIPNDDYKGLGLSEYFRDEQEMATYCNKLVTKFNSGQHDSPITIGLIMLFISYLSSEECCKTVWSDDCLMILLGRNFSFDFDTFELTYTHDPGLVNKYKFSIGNMFTFSSPFSSPAILRSQVKLLKSFSDDSVKNRDPVLFLTLLSVWKNMSSDELDTVLLETRSSLVKELLNRLFKLDNK